MRRFSLLTRWSFSKPWWDCDLLCWSRTSWRVQVWVPIKVAFSIIFVCARSALVPWTDITLKKRLNLQVSNFLIAASMGSLSCICILFFSGECYFRQWLPVSSRRTSSTKTYRGCVQRRLGTKGKRTIKFSFTFFFFFFFFFLPLIKRRRRRCLNSLLLRSRNFATMVTWRHISPLYKHWYRLITVEPRLLSLKWGSVISRFFSIRYTVTGAENIFQYTEDFVISSFVTLYPGSTVRREIGLTPLPSCDFCPNSLISIPLIWIPHNPEPLHPPPPPPPPPILSSRGSFLPCFSRFYMYLAIQQLFNNY